MGWIVFVLIFLGLIYFFPDTIVTLIYYCFHHTNEDYHISDYEEGGTPDELTVLDDYRLFYISGLKHHINENNWGTFNGYVIAEVNNPYDSHAIAVYEKSGRLLGYVPKKKNKSLHKYILSHGGKSHAYGFVRVYHGQVSGNVCIKYKNGINGTDFFLINRDYINFDGNRPEYKHVVQYYYHTSSLINEIKYPQEWINKKIYVNKYNLPFIENDMYSWIENNNGELSSLKNSDIIINFENNSQLSQIDKYKNKLIDGKTFFDLTNTKYTLDKKDKWF